MTDLADAMVVYRGAMREVKQRTDAIDRYLNWMSETKGSGNSFADAESCILQLRFICELTALATIAAHEPNKQTRKLMKEWNADRIFTQLRASNENCFPRAIVPSKEKGATFELRADAMNATELSTIYSECGGLLHRGAFKRWGTGEQRVYNAPQIVGWVNRIKDLLNLHAVLLLTDETSRIWLVNMMGPTGDIEVKVAEGNGGAVLQEPNS